MPKRVVLAMSGGVDSSVAAQMLKADGYDVVGLFMRTGSHGESAERRAKTCCSVADALDAQRVADRLEIPFFVLDFEREFGRIQDYFADEYFAGRTPNPCVMCNIWLKFGRLWEYGKQVGADFVATGHYARIARAADGTTRVGRGRDRDKDQSYVLSGLAPELLDRILFPIGALAKAEVRALALEHGLPVHDKPESQEICFIPDDDYLGFVRNRRPDQETAGTLVDEDGAVLGEHPGFEKFTIGQRRGLGIAFGEPRYVVQIEPASKTVTVGRRESLVRPGLEASRFNWQGLAPQGPAPCLAQIRARHQAVPAVVEPLGEGRVRVRFEVPQPAVAPGQVVTLYQDDLVLGGGWIDRAVVD
ncbi:tRNA 2-thiouridine(34) synthase MnmA [Planctomyces sp. SH-PL62]|uniref:tRNA 2-thiouridine(34) synthase MnmA n=1 Tax=Planctomyces sp. SH-PL62 TaxID=1636152 RepID=UPI00078D8639|nr:tRNA 2-thiouridine(34) synthase MnmA [Planctomyces sp. SH-PL62]AMV37022.1 tRNA-specific 2-thiouridylase MnmA [Planctomyces sp. SH-PL62]